MNEREPRLTFWDIEKDKLMVRYSFEFTSHYRDNRYGALVVHIIWASLFDQGSNFCPFPVIWETSCQRTIENVGYWKAGHSRRYLFQTSCFRWIKFIQKSQHLIGICMSWWNETFCHWFWDNQEVAVCCCLNPIGKCRANVEKMPVR